MNRLTIPDKVNIVWVEYQVIEVNVIAELKIQQGEN